MALLGMQADMQYKSYFPGHYSTTDLNLDAGGSTWPLNNIDKTLMKGHDYNGALLLPSPHPHLVQNKDALKQKMLKQEAMFKDQIRELHRLYLRQRELMDEMKTKLLKHHLQLETLPSNPFLLQNPLDFVQKTCHAYSLQQMNPACYRSSVLTAGNNLPLPCVKEGNSMYAGPKPAQTKFFIKDCELESKCKKFGEKILDLELPPDEHIDSEEEGCLPKAHTVLDYPLKRIDEVVHKSNLQSCHGSGTFNSASRRDNLTPSSFSAKRICLADLNEPVKLEEEADSIYIDVADLNKPTKHGEVAPPKLKFLADLNEPIKFEEETASMTIDFPSSAGDREFPCLDFSQNSNSGLHVFSKDLMQITKKRSDLETCSEGLHRETNKKEEWPSSDNEAGQSGSDSISLPPGFGGERSMSLEDAELKQTEGQSGSDSMSLPPGFGEQICTSLEDIELKQTQEFPRSSLIHQSEKKSCIEGSESLGREVSSNSFPDMDSSCQLISVTDVGNSEASSVSSWRKHVHDVMRTPIAVQALPCFSTSTPLSKNSKLSAASPRLIGKKSNAPSISFEGSDCNNNDLASEHHYPTKFVRLSMEVKPVKDINSKSVSCICTLGGEKKLEGLTRGLPWLKTKSMCKRKRGKRSELSTRVESVLERANLSCIHDVELKKVDASNNSSGKCIRGFQKIYNKSPQMLNGHSSSHHYPSEDEYIMTEEKDRVSDINLDSDPVIKSKKQLFWSKDVAGGGLQKKSSDFEVTIDLNSSIDEHEYSPAFSLSTEMDLEPPVSPENKERSPLQGESDENVEKPFQFSEKEDEDVRMDLVGNAMWATVSGQEGGDMLDELVRTAAKAIISISSSTIQTCSEITPHKPFEPCWSNELYWFAGVACLVVDDPDCEFGVALSCKNTKDDEECLSDGLDYFEAMTLKLTETKVEEQWVNKFNNQKYRKEEETVNTSLLSQTRRGRMRRRQQQQEFQSEILPSLASLSRYEVTEDMQTIEGLLEAANYSWGTFVARNSGRTSRARVKTRPCISTSNVTEISWREKGLGEGKLIGWGKITRRRRAPRCPASNRRLIQGQVN
ncbi:uncharacterized protein LOC123204493 [Mangifera indica]|uniref:uncharacterized protein LOC123204493 n=1 Tax=Mangifera indica TaxID=29780 RepID=UPI001CF9F1AB|nr:uncharacterized protein LOC123204493 [Mangifera indica]XP_044477108.1 uncharacterized protein LOC123204493 [Mangifera indica]XP_044477110.1 uncharacterized protein LOC123204493 [Mangifera indica]XP_044477111.1 uncharacterized protein LOC123204493 [Mangifera indica]